jgi:MFS family permease
VGGVADATGQALAVALLLLAGDLAPALLGPVTGTIGDRLDRKRIMIVCELLQGVLVAVTALWLPHLPPLLALVALRAAAGQVFQPASRAVVPALVGDRDLEQANAAVGIGTNGAEALGPLAAALLLPALDVYGVLLVDAATFFVSAGLLAFLPATRRHPPLSGRRTSFLVYITAGLRYLGTTATVRAIALGTSRSLPSTGSMTSPWCSWPLTPSAAVTRPWGCCWPQSGGASLALTTAGRAAAGWWPTSPSSRWAGRSITPASWPPTTRRTCPGTASPQAGGTAPTPPPSDWRAKHPWPGSRPCSRAATPQPVNCSAAPRPQRRPGL